jgi:cyclopropane fatty-acyl-phospholipid synthase-like methyltransferase
MAYQQDLLGDDESSLITGQEPIAQGVNQIPTTAETNALADVIQPSAISAGLSNANTNPFLQDVQQQARDGAAFSSAPAVPETSASIPPPSAPSAPFPNGGLAAQEASAGNSAAAAPSTLPAKPSSSHAKVAPQGLEAQAEDVINRMANASVAPGGKVRLTQYPAIDNAPLPAEGNGQFSNLHLGLLIWFSPALLTRLIPFFKPSWVPWWLYVVLAALLASPVSVAYWWVMSRIGSRKNEKVVLPGKPIESYITIKDPALKAKYNGRNKIPMAIFYEAYFDKKIDIVGGDANMLNVLEYRMDWASMVFTADLFKFVFTTLIPDVLSHSARQDEEQVRDHYDRGNDFYEWFLGPQMIYTSGMISDPTRKETLEELQDNKLSVVCSKLNLQPTDKLLDIGCGWGTLTTFAAKNFGCDATGVTLSREQTHFGNDRIKRNGVDPSRARILCTDYRDVPVEKGYYDKVVSLEMAEHVGIRHYGRFLKSIYDRLNDDGTFLLQVAGLRPQWQFGDLIWGLFMNKYIFRGADASLHVGWVITKLEKAGFEVRSCDVLGVHYSATISRWLENWYLNEEKVRAKYGERLWRIWVYFLASSVIIAREGGSSVFQITTQKNLNATHRVEGAFSHANLHPKPRKEFVSVYK